MSGIRGLLRAVLLFQCFIALHGADSRLMWSLEEGSRSCVYTIDGNTVDWVKKLNRDPEYEVLASPLCVDRDQLQIGAIVVDPVVPDVLVSTNLIDNSFVMFLGFHDGNADIFFAGAKTVTGLALDHQSQNVYYTDPNIGLAVVQFGRSRPYFRILLEGLNNPHDIQVDPDRGYLFWAEGAEIKRSDLVGGSVTTLRNDISPHTLLALDRVTRTLLVLDQQAGTLRSMGYTGGNVTTLVSDPNNIDPGTFSGIASNQGYVFGIVSNEVTIVIWNQTTGARQADLNFPVKNATQHGITATSSTPAVRTGLCQKDNGGCDHICVYQSANSRQCLCSLGYTLETNGITCRTTYSRDNFLVVSDIGTDQVYQIDLSTSTVHGIPVERTANQRIEAVDYDPVNNRLIWIDTGNGTLRTRVLANDGRESIVYTFPDGSLVEGIAYNKENGYIYYTDLGMSQIGRVSIDGGTPQTILTLTDDESPLQIKLDVNTGYMYWTNIGNAETIERAKFSDGGGRETLVNSDIEAPTGLYLDLINFKMYWSDEVLERIEKADLGGSKREMVQSAEAVYALAKDVNFIYAARTHEIRRYSTGSSPQATLGPKVFSTLYGLYLYKSDLIPDTASAPVNSAHILSYITTIVVTIWLKRQ